MNERRSEIISEPEDEATDEQIASLVQNGEKEKFEILILRYKTKLFRYGRKFIAREENIEDVIQDVFIKTYQSINSFDVSQKFSSWIYRIAHNMFVNALRKTSRGPLYFFDFDTLMSHPIYDDPVEKEKDYKEIKKMLDIGLAKLKENYREIIVLYYLEELSYKEISDILRIPVGTVGIRLKRAKDSLKKIYDKIGMKYEEKI